MQNLAFVGAFVVLALVLFAAFNMQRRQRALERTIPTATPGAATATKRPTASPAVPPQPTPGPVYPAPYEHTTFPTGPANVWWLGEPVGRLDPGRPQANRVIDSALFLGLLMRTRANPGLASLPILIESWTVSADGLVYVLHLREDILWVACDPHSGQVHRQRPVNADDFVFAIERAVEPGVASELVYLYPIAGVREHYLGEPDAALGVEAVDPSTVRLTLTHPLPQRAYAPSFLSLPVAWPVPREPVEAYGKAWVEPGKIWVNGAFCPIVWDTGRSITLIRNPWLPESVAQVLVEQVISPIDPLSVPTAPSPAPAPYPSPLSIVLFGPRERIWEKIGMPLRSPQRARWWAGVGAR